MTTRANDRLAMVVSVLLAANAIACGGSTRSDPNYSLGSGGNGMPAGGAGGDAGSSASCPAGLGPSGSGGESGGDGAIGGPSPTPGVHCDNTTNGNTNDDGGLAGEWVCPVPSDPIWPAVLPNGTTAVGVSPRLPCPTNLPAINTTFLWTSENPVCQTRGGTFADPTAGSTTFTCETAGDVTITAYFGIRNTTCAGVWSSVVQCHL
jgi:hypothetical protein